MTQLLPLQVARGSSLTRSGLRTCLEPDGSCHAPRRRCASGPWLPPVSERRVCSTRCRLPARRTCSACWAPACPWSWPCQSAPPPRAALLGLLASRATCAAACVPDTSGATAPQLLSCESYWRRRARARWSLAEPVRAPAACGCPRAAGLRGPALQGARPAQEEGGSWKRMYLERCLAEELEACAAQRCARLLACLRAGQAASGRNTACLPLDSLLSMSGGLAAARCCVRCTRQSAHRRACLSRLSPSSAYALLHATA